MNVFLTSIAIALLTACAASAPLNLTPIQPVTQPAGFIKGEAVRDLEGQLLHNDPGYIVNFAENVTLGKALCSARNGRLFIPVESNGQLEIMAVDLSGGRILWQLRLPQKATIHGLNHSAGGDVCLDISFNGRTMIFLDPDSGKEKWRYGTAAPEKHPTPYIHFSTANYAVFLSGNSISVRNPKTYEIISTADRYATDLQGVNFFKGSPSAYPPFHNFKVIKDEDRYLILDHGLHALSKQTGRILWSTRFPTIATQFHITENILGMVMELPFVLFLGGGSHSNYREPDVMYPELRLIKSGGYYYVCALDKLYCLDRTTGAMQWARDLNLGYVNLMDAHGDRLFLVSTGKYENGVCSIEKESGKLIPCLGAVSTKKVDVLPLSVDAVAGLTESEVWAENKTCYRSAVAKKKITDGGRRLWGAVALPAKIVILASDGIHFLDKTDCQPAGHLPNPREEADKFRKIRRLSPQSVLAVSKRRIIRIDSNTLEPSWSLDMPWALDNLDHFHITSISEEHLYIRTIVDKTTKVCVVDKQTGYIIKCFEADQTLWTRNLLALQNGKRVSIYLEHP